MSPARAAPRPRQARTARKGRERCLPLRDVAVAAGCNRHRNPHGTVQPSRRVLILTTVETSRRPRVEGANAPAEDPALAEVVRRLVAAYEPDRIYLFGSYARGDPGPDSDYDLMVVVPDSAPPERRRAQLAYRALRGTGTAADVLVATKGYFETRLRVRASLPATIAREGALLYGA